MFGRPNLHGLALFDRVAATIAQWAVRPLHASVFGSTARGDGNTSSDIDLLIVRPDDLDAEGVRVWEDQVGLLRDTVRGWTGNRCQTLVIDHTRLGEHVTARDPLVASWLRDGILLCGAPIRDLGEIPFTEGACE